MTLYTHVHYKGFACRCGVIIGNLPGSVNESPRSLRHWQQRSYGISAMRAKSPGLVPWDFRNGQSAIWALESESVEVGSAV